MCNRYLSPDEADIERYWEIDRKNPWPKQLEIFPRAPGPFIRPVRDSGGTELVVGQWGLIPWFAKTAKLTYPQRVTLHKRLQKLREHEERYGVVLKL